MVKVKYQGKTFQFEDGITVGEIFENLSINPEEHLAVLNGQLKTEDEKLSSGDELEIVKVVSGG